MILYLAFISWLGFAFGFIRYIRIPSYQAPFLALCIVFILQYLFGLFGLLALSQKILIMIGITLFFNELFIIIRAKDFSKLIPPSIVVLAFTFFLLIFKFDQRFFIYDWDDFVHWAFYAFELIRTDSFSSAISLMFFKYYPPGPAIWIYYFTNGSQEPSEGLLLAIQGFVVTSALLSLNKLNSWRNSKNALMAFVVALMFFYCFSDFRAFDSLYVDLLMSLIFGSAIKIALDGINSKKDMTAFCIVLFCLTLQKEIGFIWSFVALGVLLVKSLLEKISARRLFVLMAAPMIFVLIAKISWSHYLEENGHVNRRVEVLAQDRTWKDFIFLDNYRIRIAEKFTQSFISKVVLNNYDAPLKLRLSNLVIIILLYASAYIMRRWGSRELGLQLLKLNHLMGLGYLPYLGVLYIAYAFTFTEYEGTKLGDFTRYTSTYILIWIILFSTKIYLSDFKKSNFIKIILFVVCLLSAPMRFWHLFSTDTTPKLEKRLAVEQIVAQVGDFAAEENKIYFIWPYSNGFEHRIFGMLIRPSAVEPWGWSIGTPSGPDDVWTVPANQKTFKEAVSSYNYILVAENDANFWQQFGDLFEKQVLGVFDTSKMPYKLVRKIDR